MDLTIWMGKNDKIMHTDTLSPSHMDPHRQLLRAWIGGGSTMEGSICRHTKMLATPSHKTWLLCPLTLVKIFIILVWTCQALRSFGWTIQGLIFKAIILVLFDEFCLVYAFMTFSNGREHLQAYKNACHPLPWNSTLMSTHLNWNIYRPCVNLSSFRSFG